LSPVATVSQQPSRQAALPVEHQSFAARQDRLRHLTVPIREMKDMPIVELEALLNFFVSASCASPATPIDG
jgi:hypothetical protein